MNMRTHPPAQALAGEARGAAAHDGDLQTVLSFDVEEHDRIEAAAGLVVADDLKARYRERLEPTTRWLLELLDRRGLKATFFVVGQIARHNPGLVRSMHAAGHEV